MGLASRTAGLLTINILSGLQALAQVNLEGTATLAADPGNVEALYEIARSAELAAERDPEDARRLLQIAAINYERIEILNEDVPQVALRLGEIYYRLSRYAEARGSFERALADPALPPDIRASAERYLAMIQKELDPSGFSGSVFAGLRYQTNATAAPVEDLGDFEEFITEDPGTDAFFALRLIHTYDPGWQRRHTIETRLDLDGNYFLDEDDLDTYAADLSFGPRLDLSSYGAGATSLRPHLVGSALIADGALFRTEAGVGVEADIQVSRAVWASALLRGVSQTFNETLGNPELDDRDGWQYTARLTAEYRATPALSFGTALEAVLKDAEAPDQEYRRLGAEVSASLAHGAPAGPGAGSWVSRLTFGWSEARYELPNLIPGNPRRRDDYFWTRLSSELPVAPSVSLAASLGYTDRESTLAQFDYDNLEVALGIAYQF